MNKAFDSNSTSQALRQLADKIDADIQSDFLLIISDGVKDFKSTYKIDDNPWLVVGAIESVKSDILEEIG